MRGGPRGRVRTSRGRGILGIEHADGPPGWLVFPSSYRGTCGWLILLGVSLSHLV